MKNVLIFGDSVLKGVTYIDGKYHVCKDKLSMDSVEFKNFSKMGATIDTGLKIIDNKIDRCDENTVAILEFGGNDCNYDWSEISNSPEKEHECVTMPNNYVKSFNDAIKKLKAKGTEVIISSLIPISSKKFMDFISRGNSYNNILKWLGDIDRLYRWQSYYNNLAYSVAKENNCTVMPLRNAFETDDYETLLCDDGIHPTEEGHKVIHRFLENYICSVV